MTQSVVMKEQLAQKQLFDQESMDEVLKEFPERDRINRELLLCRDFMPFVPPLVLKVNLPITLKDQSNT